MSLIIEHLEDDFYDWCRFEYERIADFIQPHVLHITNFPLDLLRDNVKCYKDSLQNTFPKDRVCLLDSEANEALSPNDLSNFDYFLLGGILGNVDEFDFDRTKVLRDQGFARRNLGPMQMTTDTAAMVTSLIIHKRRPIDSLKFVDRPEFPVGSKEMLVMNFRYLAKEDGSADIDSRILDLAVNGREFDLSDLE